MDTRIKAKQRPRWARRTMTNRQASSFSSRPREGRFPGHICLVLFIWVLGGSCHPPGLSDTILCDDLGIEWVELGSGSDGSQQPGVRVLISRWEITNWQYEHWDRSHWRDPISAQNDQPVSAVSLEDAAGFCKWLSKESGCLVRLPTEAEWEQGATLDLSVRTDGQLEGALDSLQRSALCRNNGGPETITWPAGTAWRMVEDFVPTSLEGTATEDMIGNVWEWCSIPAGNGHPPGGRSGAEHGLAVCRGGSVLTADAAVSSREVHAVNLARGDIGFRVVLLPTLQGGDDANDDAE
jgi:formylglycine-generating enzyme required for sulfatase activity